MKDFPSYGAKNKSHRIVRQKPISQDKKIIQILILGIIIIGVALFFIQQRIKFIETQRRVTRLSIEKRKLVSEILPLKIEEQYLSKLDIVEEVSKNEFQLQFPKKRQIKKIKLHVTPQK